MQNNIFSIHHCLNSWDASRFRNKFQSKQTKLKQLAGSGKNQHFQLDLGKRGSNRSWSLEGGSLRLLQSWGTPTNPTSGKRLTWDLSAWGLYLPSAHGWIVSKVTAKTNTWGKKKRKKCSTTLSSVNIVALLRIGATIFPGEIKFSSAWCPGVSLVDRTHYLWKSCSWLCCFNLTVILHPAGQGKREKLESKNWSMLR